MLEYFSQLNRSFAAVYAILERPRAAQKALACLLIIHTSLLVYSAYVHSPTFNEPAHLIAGLAALKSGRTDIYSVNPPLVKSVAAIPVVIVGCNEDWHSLSEHHGSRSEFMVGKDFVAANGERSFLLFTIARWCCIPFSWLGAIICYMWARDLFGHTAGVLAAAIWCFEPNILGNSALITPDVAAAALGSAACYTFWRWLRMPSWSQAMLTGVVLGVAETAKTTLLVFYPLWPLMWVVYRWSNRRQMNLVDWWREGAMLFVRMLVGVYVLNLAYGFEGSLQPLRDFEFVSELLGGRKASTKSSRSTEDSLYDEMQLQSIGQPTNRFRDSWLGAIPVPFPAQFVSGVDLQQRDFESYGRKSYLHGTWRYGGWWYYYFYAAAIKVPLGIWLLAFGTLVHRSQKSSVRARDVFALVAPSLTIFAIASSKTGLNEHFRYVLPCLPFLFIAAAGVVAPNHISPSENVDLPPHVSLRFGRLAIAICLLWAMQSSLWIYPHTLSYFNEVVGGPLNGPHYLLGSNSEWGQDLRYAESFALPAKSETGCYSKYIVCESYLDFGGAKRGVITYSPAAISQLRKDARSGRWLLQPGIYFFSVNLLAQMRHDCDDLSRSLTNLIVFDRTHCIGTCGYSIRVFLVRNESPYPKIRGELADPN